MGLDGLQFPNYVPEDPLGSLVPRAGTPPVSVLCFVLIHLVQFGESFLLLKKDLKTASRWILPVVPAHTNHESFALATDPGGHVAFLVAASWVRMQALITSCFPGEKVQRISSGLFTLTFPVWAAPASGGEGVHSQTAR